MDTPPARHPDLPVAVTGLGHVALAPEECTVDPRVYLKVKKNRKFMAVQDDLAVVAAGRALEAAGLLGAALGERTGLFLAVGPIPFREVDLDPIVRGSDDGGRFSLAAFSTTGVQAAHPLLTFRCLPNMPAFHVSSTFGVQGPYLVTYPGPGQLYLVLEEALDAVATGRLDRALVAGVAFQRNLLCRHHFARLDPPVDPDALRDGAGCVVLEREEVARARGAPIRRRLVSLSVGYTPHAPFETGFPLEESFAVEGALEAPAGELGPASLPVMLSLAGDRRSFVHTLRSRDGIRGASRWEAA